MKNENTDAIFSILDSQPWTDQAKAAIMGTIFEESKFNPGVENEKEGAWGLFQYRNVPQEEGMSAPDPRKNKLFSYLDSEGLIRSSADGQLEYFLKDVKENYPEVYEVLTDRDATIDEATAAITNNYIFPHESVRSQRYDAARKYANLYGLDAGPESNVEIQEENDMSVLDNLDIDALTTLAGDSANAETALKLARALRPKPEEFDPAVASLLYFTKMGELANQPGSTLLGSASGAFASPAEYLMRTKKSQRDALAAEGPLAVDFAKALKTSSTSASGSNVQRSVVFNDSSVLLVLKNGETVVRDSTGKTITDPTERAKVLADGRESGIMDDIRTAGGESAVKLGVEMSQKAFEQIPLITKNIDNLKKGVELLERGGAKTGFLERYLPDYSAGSVALSNLQQNLGLDVIGSVTFGALSEGELNLALQTALPTGLNEPELIDWLNRKIAAQEKLLNYVNEQASFLGTGTKTIADWQNKILTESRARIKDEQSEFILQVPSMDADQLREMIRSVGRENFTDELEAAVVKRIRELQNE
jgi:hypothetical protein